MNRLLVYLSLLFEAVGLIWGLVVSIQNHTPGQFFANTQWPIFIGFILLLIAVANGLFKKAETHKTEPPSSNISPQI